MTHFGTWLGRSNGRVILANVFDNCTKEQARAAVTTYCIIFGVEPDKKEWDELIHWIDDYYNSWFNDFKEMDSYMSELLV